MREVWLIYSSLLYVCSRDAEKILHEMKHHTLCILRLFYCYRSCFTAFWPLFSEVTKDRSNRHTVVLHAAKADDGIPGVVTPMKASTGSGRGYFIIFWFVIMIIIIIII